MPRSVGQDISWVVLGVVFLILGFLAIYGGVCAIRRKNKSWAIIGSAFSILGVLGIPAAILIAKSETEFS